MNLFDGVAPALSVALIDRGYEQLTPVQSAVLETESKDRDLLVSAQTGSGKTVAFGLAIAPNLLLESETLPKPGEPLALVVAPTRELAIQVKDELEWLYKKTGAKVISCVGGMDMREQRRNLARGVHIVVGTPGRLRDHIERGSLDLDWIRAVILDEADEMLDLGFREDLEFILGAAPKERRTLLFSATVPKQIGHLAARFQNDALRLKTEAEKKQHADIEYKVYQVSPREREKAVINTLRYYEAQSAMVFCQTRDAVNRLTSRLSNRGFSVVALSGELNQDERSRALQAMRDGRARVCVATDVAARGIDLPSLELVIHADLPNNSESLLHRSGRTGRAGRKGTAILIAPFSKKRVADRLLRGAKINAKWDSCPDADDIRKKDRERILNDAALGEPMAEGESELVSALLEKHSAEQIAAAYLRGQLAMRPPPEEIEEAAYDRSGPADRGSRGGDRQGRPDRPKREPRTMRSDFEGGVWFKVNAGHKHRAEPRWLLPMICRAGDITKQQVGSIRILDTEARFEISPDAAETFFSQIEQNGTGEKSLTITRFKGDPNEGGGDRGAPREGNRKPDGKPGGYGKDRKGKKSYGQGHSGGPGKPRRPGGRKKD